MIGTNVYNVHVPKYKKVQNKSRNEETIDKCPTGGNKCLKKKKKEKAMKWHRKKQKERR